MSSTADRIVALARAARGELSAREIAEEIEVSRQYVERILRKRAPDLPIRRRAPKQSSTIYTRRCHWCRREFETDNPSGLYCSRRCTTFAQYRESPSQIAYTMATDDPTIPWGEIATAAGLAHANSACQCAIAYARAHGLPACPPRQKGPRNGG